MFRAAYLPRSAGRIVSQASLPPHLQHFSRRSQAGRLPGPQHLTTSGPLSVLEAPHLAQSIFTLAPNLTKSQRCRCGWWTLPSDKW